MGFRAPRQLYLPLAAGAIVAAAGCNGGDDEVANGERETRAGSNPVVSARVPVLSKRDRREGAEISSVAAGQGGVWVGATGCPGSVSRIDPESDQVVAKLPVGFVTDVAVGEGAVWAVGSICPSRRRFEAEGPEKSVEHKLFRIDPRTNELAATIPLDRQGRAHLAAGEGGVWVPVGSSDASGEILRIDPRTNEVAARIPVQGNPGDIEARGGAVWSLASKPAGRPSSLHRIDPRTNKVVATLAREKLAVVGGSVIPPLMAVGDSAVWIRGEGLSRAAFRVDVETNEVARERIDDGRFFPFAVAAGGVWFVSDGVLKRLDPRTLEIDETVEVGRGADAAFDRGSRSFWFVEDRSVVRVDLRD